MKSPQSVDHPTTAEALIVCRQVIAFGCVCDQLSGVGLHGFTIEWGYRDEQGPGTLPIDLSFGAGGWFAAHLGAASLPGDFPHGSQVQLTADFAAPGHQPAQLQVQVPAVTFGLVQSSLPRHPDSILLRLAGPPVHLDARLLPLPVGLRGIVIYDNDPSSPVPGASIEVPGLAPATTDDQGRFSLAALPVAAQLQMRVSDGTHHQIHHLTVDYGQPVNVAALSLTRSNVE